jgi:hypothetical protein
MWIQRSCMYLLTCHIPLFLLHLKLSSFQYYLLWYTIALDISLLWGVCYTYSIVMGYWVFHLITWFFSLLVFHTLPSKTSRTHTCPLAYSTGVFNWPAILLRQHMMKDLSYIASLAVSGFGAWITPDHTPRQVLSLIMCNISHWGHALLSVVAIRHIFWQLHSACCPQWHAWSLVNACLISTRMKRENRDKSFILNTERKNKPCHLCIFFEPLLPDV